ncbi:MAG: efflux RND transporter periplasmic adaptor subunit [Rickettsiaceae bacterium]
MATSQSNNRFINKYTVSLVIILIIGFIIINSIYDQDKVDDIKIIRPVRTIKVEHKIAGQSLSLTGTVLAKNEIDLSFRIDGKLTERLVSVGDKVSAEEIVARIDPQDAKDNFTSAKSNLNSAQASLTQATSNESRQKTLLSKGVITNSKYEDAVTQLQSAQAKFEGASANLNQAQNRLEYTNLKIDTAGVVTTINSEAGEVVKAGQVIMSIATNEGRDAVFNVPEQLFQNKPSSGALSVEVSLSYDPTIKTIGVVREVSPQPRAIA